jgi:molybdate transport repressor ModE-like protein
VTTGDEQRIRRLQLADLELFAHVADAGSITHGAQRAHLSLPAASARISQMEATVGAPLLERGRRGVTLTPAGRLLRRHARTVIAQLDRLGSDLASYSAARSATVRVAATGAAIATFVPARVISFLAAHPDVNVDLSAGSSRDVTQRVMSGAVDLGIVSDTASPTKLELLPIVDDELVLVTEREGPLAARDRVTLQEAMASPFVGLTEGRTEQQHHDGSPGPPGPRLIYRVRFPTIDAVCAAVAAGVGVSILPERAVKAQPHDVRVVRLDEPWAKRGLVLCCRGFDDLSAPALQLARVLGGAFDTGEATP